MAYIVDKHLLQVNGAPVRFVDTPNKGGNFTPRFLVMHYTAGVSADGAISWLTQSVAQASAHLVIDRDGAVTELVAFNRVAWHAGKSQWGALIGMNGFSIGIELVNAGKLKRRADGKWVNWSDTVIPDHEVVELTHKAESSPAGWQVFSSTQLDAAAQIGVVLRTAYGLEDVLGHDDIAPGRKVDPGPAFPMLSFGSRVMGRK